MQQDHWMFLFTETCKSILKRNWFTCIFEIGHILLQSVLTGPDATFYTTTNTVFHELQKLISGK